MKPLERMRWLKKRSTPPYDQDEPLTPYQKMLLREWMLNNESDDTRKRSRRLQNRRESQAAIHASRPPQQQLAI